MTRKAIRKFAFCANVMCANGVKTRIQVHVHRGSLVLTLLRKVVAAGGSGST